MEATVHVSKAALDYFRKRARDCPYEIQAYLLGDVYHNHHINITSIEHAREYDIQDKGHVAPTGAEFDRIKQLAIEQGHLIIGDIHSHPDEDPIMSPSDYRACLEDNMRICAIVGVRKRRTKVFFWQAGSPLPCEVEHKPYIPEVR